MGKKETRIYPNISLIQKEVRARQAENFDSEKRIIRNLIPKIDIVRSTRRASDHVPISENLEVKIIHAKAEEA